MPFTFHHHDLPDLVLIEARTMSDERGWFRETYRRSAFAAAGIGTELWQDNLSSSARRGTLRGLHYQLAAAAQGKLVRCAQGAIYDVAVDLRRGSPTYARWAATELVAADSRMLWVPEGFAHGFQALSDEAIVAYRTTAEYSPDHERGIRWSDPRLAIPWPIDAPILSSRDATLPTLADAECDFVYPR